QKATFPAWPYEALLELTTTISANAVTQELKVSNRGTEEFSWTGGLHPYFYTDDLLHSSLQGLQGARVKDRYDSARHEETESKVQWDGSEFERSYDTRETLIFSSASQKLKLSMTGFDQWMVWNPGIAGAQV